MTDKIPFEPGDQVAGYFRDSGGDEQDLSIQRQLAEFRHWLQENNLREGELFTDAAKPGGTVVGRTGFHDMLRHFRSEEATEKGLVVWRFNRFGRNADQSQYYKADIRRRGYVIHSLKDPVTNDRFGRLYESILEWKDEDFLETLSEDVSSGLNHIVETYGAMPGTPPRGFTRQEVTVGTRRDGRPHILHRWVPDETMTPLVRRAYQMLLDGSPLINIQTVTGLYTSLNSWSTFFRNPLYKGTLVYKDLVIENYCPPVVDLLTWERAQRILERRTARKTLRDSETSPELHPRRVSSPWLLSGLAHCARCAAPMNGHVINEHQYYACSRSIRRRDCNVVKIPARPLEEHILEAIQALLSDPAAIAAAQSQQLQEYEQTLGELPARLQELVVRLANLRREIGNITGALAKRPSSDALLDKLTALEEQEHELKAELAEIELTLQAKPEPIGPQKLRRLADKFDQVMAAGSPEEQRQALAGWIHSLFVERLDKQTIQVGLKIHLPPFQDPDRRVRHNQNLVLRFEPRWGHLLIALKFNIPIDRKKYTRH